MTARHRDSFTPGQVWLDTEGKRIQAHGGSILQLGDTFYWYGENKEKTVTGGGIWHWGIRLYASRDLYNWEDRGLIIPPEPDDPGSPLHPARQVDRPHIIHDERTGRFVCWIKIMGTGTQESTVLVADALEGPYRIVRTGLLPNGMSAGDFDLVVDPDTGRGYYFHERPHSELVCAELTDDYTDVSGAWTSHFPQPGPPLTREAPAYFRRGGQHYLFTSGTSGYFPNPSEVAVADDYHGPWKVLGNPHPGEATGTSYRSQITSVFRHPGRKDLYIALADRWLPGLSPEMSARAARAMAAMRAEEHTADTDLARQAPPELLDPNTSVADYVWLPVRFDGGMPVLDRHDEWRIEDYEEIR